MTDLFERAASQEAQRAAPLAERMRPRTLEEVEGQDKLLREGGALSAAIAADRIGSFILCGPPGSGKTTIARVIAQVTSAHFEPFSAVLGGVAQVREIVAAAKKRWVQHRVRTILFVDEIHRFNKSQQDAFLPHVEQGTIVLVGATTENPSFAINGALLSRCRVWVLEPLGEEALTRVLRRALEDCERGLGELELSVTDEVLRGIARHGDGDARRALLALEQVALWAAGRGEPELTLVTLEEFLSKQPLRYDRAGDGHYDCASALIKSMRGSDPDAALYELCRMLEAGEDPRFILRRVLIFASEDVGNADPRALQVALAAHQAFQVLGLPEGAIPMAQAVCYCATAPKSNASYQGLNEARRVVKETGDLPIPLHIVNAPTQWMKGQGRGADYLYPHDHPGGYVPGVTYLPDALENRRFYRPKGYGYEQYIVERMRRWHGEGE